MSIPAPDSERRAERTYFWERIRAVFSGMLEIIWQPGAAVALLVAIRVYDSGAVAKSVISASGFIGFLITPLTLGLFARSGRPIHEIMRGLFVMTGVMLCLVPVIPGAGAFLLLVSGAHVVMVQYMPLYTEMYSSHFTTSQRGHRIATVFMITGAVSIVANAVTGELLDRDLGWYGAVMGLGGLCAFGSAFCLGRIRTEPLRRDQVGNPLRNLGLAWRDKLFGWLLSSWMLLGFGNLMTLPLRTEYMANPRFGINASNQTILLVTGAVPLVFRLVASRGLGRLFDRWNLVKLRILLNGMFVVSIGLFFSTRSVWVMGVSMALLGTAMAGGRIAWSLWVTKLAPPGQSSAYMSVHMLSTGLRGSLAPFLGYALIERFAIRDVSVMGLGLVLISTLMFVPAIRHMQTREEKLEALGDPSQV